MEMPSQFTKTGGFTDLPSANPIGIFDSGLGGLTVARQLFKQLPDESTVYLADSARVPYGLKSTETVKGYVLEICRFLTDQGCKAIVIACNTATAAGLEAAQARIDVPVIGVIKPGAKMAVDTTKNGKVGVLATEGTIRSQAYVYEIRSLMPKAQVFGQPCTRFTELVETGMKNPEEIRECVRGYVKSLEATEIDTLVLGCTHYPLLAEYIQEAVGEHVALVDPAHETVSVLERDLCSRDELAPRGAPKRVYYTSGDTDTFRSIASLILALPKAEAERMDVRKVTWEV